MLWSWKGIVYIMYLKEVADEIFLKTFILVLMHSHVLRCNYLIRLHFILVVSFFQATFPLLNNKVSYCLISRYFTVIITE